LFVCLFLFLYRVFNILGKLNLILILILILKNYNSFSVGK